MELSQMQLNKAPNQEWEWEQEKHRTILTPTALKMKQNLHLLNHKFPIHHLHTAHEMLSLLKISKQSKI
jgi:hypothetical protein